MVMVEASEPVQARSPGSAGCFGIEKNTHKNR
jgi:hypothetical protein